MQKSSLEKMKLNMIVFDGGMWVIRILPEKLVRVES